MRRAMMMVVVVMMMSVHFKASSAPTCQVHEQVGLLTRRDAAHEATEEGRQLLGL